MKKKPSSRLRFPEDEKKHSWLPLLLDAYSIVDQGVASAVSREKRRRRAELACRRGCDSCCRFQKDIPVYPLELVGIYWYVIEKMAGPARSEVREKLAAFRHEDACPFLVGSACSIHPLRPVGCRLFNVFGTSCEEGEDPFYTRRDDVLTPPPEITERAFRVMLPFYGYRDEKAQDAVIRNRLLHAEAQPIHSLTWQELGLRMDEYDGRKEKP
ncbi:MAG: YkgJ family cysteine cluster protein [Thermodesulfovibrionales bacterium]